MTADQPNPTPDAADEAFGRRWVTEFTARFESQANVLADLDRQAGDGDFGTNLGSALRRAQDFLDRDNPRTFADVFFAAVAKGFLNTGGTSGPLFGMWFREIAKAASDAPVSTAALATGVANGLATIQRLAGAEVGDSTMVDALAPGAAALQAGSAAGVGVREALRRPPRRPRPAPSPPATCWPAGAGRLRRRGGPRRPRPRRGRCRPVLRSRGHRRRRRAAPGGTTAPADGPAPRG